MPWITLTIDLEVEKVPATAEDGRVLCSNLEEALTEGWHYFFARDREETAPSNVICRLREGR